MSNESHLLRERLTAVEIKPESRVPGLCDLGDRIFREALSLDLGGQIDAVIVVYHSTWRSMLVEDFSIVQSVIQQRCHVSEIECKSSVVFRGGNGPSFQIVIDRWYPVTISFYNQHRFDLRATRGLTNYSIIQVHEGPRAQERLNDETE